jgi:Rod binding domain-containing protein
METRIGDTTRLPGVDPVAREMQRLRRAAGDFESVMLGVLLKEMRSSIGPGGGPGGAILDDFGTESLARGVAQQGGLGIAEILVRTMTPQVMATAAHHAEGGKVG